MNSFISKSEFNQEFSFLHYLLLLLVILYSQVLSGIMVSGDRVILFLCVFFVYILREVKCKFMIIYIYIKIYNDLSFFTCVLLNYGFSKLHYNNVSRTIRLKIYFADLFVKTCLIRRSVFSRDDIFV